MTTNSISSHHNYYSKACNESVKNISYSSNAPPDTRKAKQEASVYQSETE